MIVKAGYEWCASIDLAKFFDEIPHNLIFEARSQEDSR
jgi:hypothetical protein